MCGAIRPQQGGLYCEIEQNRETGKLCNRRGHDLGRGAFDFDGTGKFLGKQTSLRYKTSVQRENLSGTYTLEADCTGTMTLEGQLGGTAHWDVLVTQDGKKGRMIRTDSGARGVRTFEQ
jgi:hypothetical protein